MGLQWMQLLLWLPLLHLLLAVALALLLQAALLVVVRSCCGYPCGIYMV